MATASPTKQTSEAPETAPEGPESPRLSLSASLAVGAPDVGPNPILGALPPVPALPDLPPELDAELNPRERRIVLAMVAGNDYASAVRSTQPDDATGRALPRTDCIPANISAAVAHIYREMAAAAGLSRAWIIAQTVALFERAAQAVPVLDRKGRPTGEYRFDGATAANCLKMLAEWQGELYPRRAGAIPVSDVAELLRVVADRGRPGLDQRRAPRLLDMRGSAQEPESPA